MAGPVLLLAAALFIWIVDTRVFFELPDTHDGDLGLGFGGRLQHAGVLAVRRAVPAADPAHRAGAGRRDVLTRCGPGLPRRFLEPPQHRVGVLTEQRRCGVVEAPLGAVLVEEPQRRTRQLDPTERRVIDVEHQSLGPGLLPLVHLLQILHLAAGHPDLGQPVRAARRSTTGRTRHPPPPGPPPSSGPGRGWWRSRARSPAGRRPARTAPTVPPIRPRSAPSRPRCGTARTGRSTGGAGPPPGAPPRPPSTGCPDRRAPRPPRPAARCGPTRRVRWSPARAVRPPPRRRRTSPRAGRRSAPRPSSESPDRGRSSTSGPPRPGRSGRSRPGRLRVRRARTRRSTACTSRGLSSTSRSTGKPSRSNTPGRKFSSSTSLRRTSSVRAACAVVALQVERHRLLVAVAGQEVRGHRAAVRVVDERRPPAPGVVARTRRLDLDHPGAQVPEHHRGVRAGERPGQVEHGDVRQRSVGHRPRLSTQVIACGTGRGGPRSGTAGEGAVVCPRWRRAPSCRTQRHERGPPRWPPAPPFRNSPSRR